MVYTDLNTEIDIGSSGHLLEIGSFKILIDCGLHPKYMGLSALPRLDKILPETLDFITVTHSHLDHCGGLPVALRTQHSAHVMVAQDGSELLFRMLRNSRKVMEKQREEFGVREYPLFDNASIDDIRGRLLPMPFFHQRQFAADGDSIGITYFPAGHIPGAASILFEHKHQKVFFSGDISFHSTGVLRGAEPPDCDIDTMVIETTRGEHSRPEGVTYESEVERFVSSVARVISDGGSVLVPSFALGRMQDIIYIIYKAKQKGRIPMSTPVFAGGLGLDIAEYFEKMSKHASTFSFGKQYMEGVKPMRGEIVPGKDFEEKGIYVLGSGMMVEKTPSYLAAAAIMEERSNAIFFVGYADKDTPAARMCSLSNGDHFAFRDLAYVGSLNCKVDKFDLTSHADREQILDFTLARNPRCVILTHGSMESREWFMDEIIDRAPKTQVIIPEPSQTLEL